MRDGLAGDGRLVGVNRDGQAAGRKPFYDAQDAPQFLVDRQFLGTGRVDSPPT